VLIAKGRKAAQAYFRVYREEMPVLQLVRELAMVMQEFTQSGGVRPFGISLLLAGFDHSGPHLYQIDPSGSFIAWKANAIGKNFVNAKSFLEKRYEASETARGPCAMARYGSRPLSHAPTSTLRPSASSDARLPPLPCHSPHAAGPPRQPPLPLAQLQRRDGAGGRNPHGAAHA
jgi:hypothetical protein